MLSNYCIFDIIDNGNIDFDALLVQSPERFLQEFSAVVGEDRTMVQLERTAANIDEQIQQVTGKLDKSTSLNETVKLQNEINNLTRQKNSIQSILSQGQETGQETEEILTGPQGNSIENGEIFTNSEEIGTIPQTEEVDDYGNHFVLASDGSSDFGVVDAESGLRHAPIKLSMGDNTVDKEGNNHGYGLLHIEAERGDAIRKAGYKSVQDFVESVAKNYTDIREGAIIANNQTYLLELVDEHNNTLFIQLSKNGEYWTINSAGIFRKKYSRNKPKVYNRPALGSDTGTDISRVDSGHIEGATTPAGNSPQTSESKGKQSSPQMQTPEQQESSVKTKPIKQKTILESALDSNANAALEQQAEQVNTEPTEGQKEAGNYKMGHIKINGFDITIENPKGSIRSGIDNNGIPWEVQMNNHYGSFRRTEGKDGDQIDVFIGDSPISGKIFIVDQVDENGNFDEHKVMMGFDSIEEAQQAYLSNYSPGWNGLGNITEVSQQEFKDWVKDGKRKMKPYAENKQQQSSKPTVVDVVKTLYTEGKDVASKLFQRSFFDVAKTPKFMKELGLRGDKFTIKYGNMQIMKQQTHLKVINKTVFTARLYNMAEEK